LADQVASELRRLARSIHNIKVLTLCGGAPFGPQIGSNEYVDTENNFSIMVKTIMDGFRHEFKALSNNI
jgi:superfamily II DNA/RNA helicase